MNDQKTASEEPASNGEGDSGSVCNDLLSGDSHFQFCPICGRDRKTVADAFSGADHPILTRGAQIALGKGRTSCVECGLKVLQRRDERANAKFRAHTPAEALLKSLMSQCRKLVASRDNLKTEVDSVTTRLRDLRGLSWWQRLVFIVRGTLPPEGG